MLTSIKERATGWIAWAIVILITIPFALWGVNSYFSGVSEVSVAEFDGEEIDYQTYQQALSRERQRIRELYGQDADTAELLSGGILGRRVVSGLVNEVLLYRDAYEQGYRISDEQLVKAIRGEPAFQSNDQFSREQYERVLRLSGLAVGEFEAVQRSNAILQQIQTGFIQSAIAPDPEVDGVLSILLQSRTGEYVIIDPAAYISSVEVTEEEIKAEYEKSKAQFVEDGKIKVQYIELSLADFAANFTPTEETLRKLYDADVEQFRQEEQRNISHILLEKQVEGSSNAQNLALELIERLNAGEDFGALAAEYSTDVSSAENQGNLGWFSRGLMPSPEFEAVAFSLETGQFSDPVESDFGIHIVRVDEIQGVSIKDFEEVRDQLIEQSSRAQAEAEMFETAEQLRNIAYEQPESLEPAAESLGLDLKISQWFTKDSGTEIADSDEVRSAAFSEDVLQQGYNSDLIEIDDVQVVLRKFDYQEIEQLSLDKVRDEIKERLLISKSSVQAQNFAEKWVSKLSKGASWESILSDNGLTASDIPSHSDELTDPLLVDVLRHVYTAEKPVNNKYSYGSGPLNEGKTTMFRLAEVIDGDVATATEEQRQNIIVALENRFGEGLFDNYLTLLKQGIEVNINEELL